ncbi:MAG: cobalamin B12-binding domain-containing protein [Candidatus Ranarchaeia archaeon]
MEILEKLSDAIIDGEQENAIKLAKKALDAGVSPLTIIEEGVSKAMRQVGDKFEKFEYFLSDLMIAGEAAKAVSSLVSPLLAEGKQQGSGQGTIVLGTAKGDIHDIGKNIVSVMFETGGFKVVDIGVDASIEKFVDMAEQVKANIIACSALMRTSLPFIKELIEYLKDKRLREKYKILVGGGAVESKWSKEVGADGYAADASEAVKVAKALMDDQGRIH